MVCPDAALSSLQLVNLGKKSAALGAERLNEQYFLRQKGFTCVGKNTLFPFANLQTTSLH